MGYKTAIALVLLLTVVGCATTQTIEPVRYRAYERPELQHLVRGYVKRYGEPEGEVQAWRYDNNSQYVILFWTINGVGYKLALEYNLMKNPNGWFIDEDTFSPSRIRCRQEPLDTGSPPL